MRSAARVNWGGATLLVALAGLWQLAVNTGAVSFDYLPAPTRVALAALDAIASGDLVRATVHTVVVALTAWLLAAVVGIALGVVLGVWRPARHLLLASVDVLRTLPVIAFVPVSALLFGLSMRTEIAVASWSATWPIVVNTLGGIQAVHPALDDVAATLRLGRARRALTIGLPAAAPLVLVGLRLGLGLALIVAVATEMIANPAGLGYEIVQMQQALRPEAMFAYVLAVGVLGAVLNGGLVGAAGRIAPQVFGPRERP